MENQGGIFVTDCYDQGKSRGMCIRKEVFSQGTPLMKISKNFMSGHEKKPAANIKCHCSDLETESEQHSEQDVP